MSGLTITAKRRTILSEKSNTNMAEETHQLADEITHDDESVMSHLLKTVKGLSPISLAPVVDSIVDDNHMIEQFEFE